MKTMKNIMAAMILVVIATISTSAYACGEGSWYSDVPETHKYYSAIKEMADRGVVSPAAKFRPDDPITLREAIVMEERMFGIHPTIDNWNDWAPQGGAQYWVLNGPMAVGCFDYTKDCNAEQVCATVFAAIPSSKPAMYIGELEAIDPALGSSRIHFNSLVAYGVLDTPWADDKIEQTLSRGEFCDVLIKAAELLPDEFRQERLLSEEYNTYLYGYGAEVDDSPLAYNIEDHINEVFDHVGENVSDLYKEEGYKIFIVSPSMWPDVERRQLLGSKAAGFADEKSKSIFVGEEYLLSGPGTLTHELGHMVHFEAQNQGIDFIYENYADEVEALTCWDYCHKNQNECFAEAFEMFVLGSTSGDAMSYDLAELVQQVIDTATK